MLGAVACFVQLPSRPLAARLCRTRETRSVECVESLWSPPRETRLPSRGLRRPPSPPGWDRFPWRSCPSVCFPCRPTSALEAKCKAGEKKAETLQKEKRRLEAELEAVSQKTHDASGQLVLISQELLRKER